jgi:iron complex transport system substrate-binding protein
VHKFLVATCLFLFTSLASATGGIVSLGGSVTEIVYALGQEKQLIATDMSSLYPPEARELPQVGYYRAISLEGLVSMSPKLILASENTGPKETLNRIAELGIKVQRVSDKSTVESLYERIRQVAEVLGVKEEGDILLSEVKAAVEEVMALPTTPYRAALVVNRTGTLQVAGSGTSANELMGLAGFTNVFAAQQSYKPVSKESFLALQPEVIITTTASVEKSGGLSHFTQDPVIANTPAAASGRIVVLDDLLALGMGPRFDQVIRQLKAIP